VGFVFDRRSAEHYEEWYRGRFGKEARPWSGLSSTASWSLVRGSGSSTSAAAPGFTFPGSRGRASCSPEWTPAPPCWNKPALRLHPGVELTHGWAEHLPFADNEFDLSVMINTLEFLDNPEDALVEAIRVTRRRLVLGVLNRYALMTMHRRLRGWLGQILPARPLFQRLGAQGDAPEHPGAEPHSVGHCAFLSAPLYAGDPHAGGTDLFQHNPCGRLIVMSVDMCYRMIACKEPLQVPLGQDARPNSSGNT